MPTTLPHSVLDHILFEFESDLSFYGAKLKKFRATHSLTQTHVSQHYGKSQVTISRAERGQALVTPALLTAYHNAYLEKVGVVQNSNHT